MADALNPTKRRVRSVMLEPSGPVNPTAEEKTWRVVGVATAGRCVMLEPSGPTDGRDRAWVWPLLPPLRNTVVGEITRRNLRDRVDPDAVVLEVVTAALHGDPAPQPLEQLAAAAFRLLPAA